ncbi:hypothetical protein [Halobacillus mangrovi]|uniref:hypothetical protein n=1 Tax=Halobacillus mangrovi TaxID=402384 RepID=UPI003D99DFD4
MIKAAAILFPFFLFISTPSSFAFPVDTNLSPTNEIKHSTTQEWIENYDAKLKVITLQSKEVIEITEQNKVVEIIKAINAAYDLDSIIEKQTKLGVLEFNDLQSIDVYLSEDRESVFLYMNEDAKVLTLEEFHELFHSSGKAEPVPPGYDPKSFPPLPKGEGLDSEVIEKLY